MRLTTGSRFNAERRPQEGPTKQDQRPVEGVNGPR